MAKCILDSDDQYLVSKLGHSSLKKGTSRFENARAACVCSVIGLLY